MNDTPDATLTHKGAVSYPAPGDLISHIGALKLWEAVVDIQTRTSDVEQYFLADPAMPGCVILSQDRVFGVLSRKNFNAAISRPFGREVFMKRPVGELMKIIDVEPLILDESTTIAHALRLAMARSGEQCFEPLLVQRSDSCGLIDVNMLLTAQANLLEQALHAKDELLDEVERSANALRQTVAEQERLAKELSQAKEIAQHEATHDSLTGLPNRKMFLERLEVALDLSKQDPLKDCAVLFIDLDRFKIVNDSLGHLAGNALLQEVAKRLNQMVRKRPAVLLQPGQESRHADTIARLSGDEFTVLLTEKISSAAAMAFAGRLQTALTKPFQLGTESVVISASIGIVPSLVGYDDTESILRDADIAMYRAKFNGKACAVTFEADMRVQVATRLHIENHLREALGKQEFELHYQPIVALRTGNASGAEALVRWRRPEGLMAPGAFIEIAEETGLIIPLGNWVFREACETAKLWHAASPDRPAVTMSINLSPVQFGHPELAETLEELVLLSGVDAGAITIEITERSTMADPDRALAVLKQLKAMGFRLAIDDFGTGYSSLSYLHRFPIDILKIDRSFISNLGGPGGGEKIVVAILALADSLDITVVAEGVETEAQALNLRELGCQYAQGYLFAKPLPLDAMWQFMERPVEALI
ncbi:MAG TPA: EAL domain-containing protein [Acidocella sp.]|nr:EAL domain-containing protein [Acidocella sp.]HVE21973.1 EAL domain-containing protein [Acidocella sp.]